jgi:succinate dehydrogenase / fumarate reductase iron-sulfur subunit
VKLTLKIWRQPHTATPGKIHTYELDDVSEDMSFLEMLDVLNEELIRKGEEPVAFDSDCREGICGACGLMINGQAHGPEVTTTCQLHMRSFKDGDEIVIEPWRADPFPVLKDLMVDRGAFDRIIASGGYISVNTGAAPDAHAMPVPKDNAVRAFDAATCIPCSASVTECPNASAPLSSAVRSPISASCLRAGSSAIRAWCGWLRRPHRPMTTRATVADKRCRSEAGAPSPLLSPIP